MVFLSTNEGASWTEINTGITNLRIQCLYTEGANIYAGTSSGIFHSSNNGESWNLIKNGDNYFSVISILKKESEIFAGTYGGIYSSSDAGTTWNLADSSLIDYNICDLESQNSNILAGTSKGLYSSKNGGGSWQAINSGLTQLNTNILSVSDSNLIVSTENSELFITSDKGFTWSKFDLNLPKLMVYSLLKVDTNYYYVGTSQGLFESIYADGKWTSKYSRCTEYYVYSIKKNGSRIIVGTWGQGILLTTNDGTK
mgnify:CR=1 FL=1